MKILIFSDVHWSKTTSIVRTRSENYSTRLQLLINSMNWVNKMAEENNCSAMICAGDFFDKSITNDEELTALREINWNNLPCYFLCGNHESSTIDLRFNTLKALESNNHFIITEPTVWKFNNDENEIRFLPYVVESERKQLQDYFYDCTGKSIIISHNDIAGIKYGGFESKFGFSIDEIESNCDLYLNGHLHNSEWITDKILNVGSLSAHNFTNDSLRYKYGIWILDTDTLQMKFIENPYGLSFYKLELNKATDLNIIDKIKPNAVLSIKCDANISEELTTAINRITNSIVAQKINIVKTTETCSETSIAELHSADHLTKFVECCISNIGDSQILRAELAELCK